MANKKRPPISEEVIKILREEEVSNTIYHLRIVIWNYTAPKLEKRMKYESDELDELRSGKCVGLTVDDVELIIKRKR